jgi:hypothetical protein
MVSPERLGEIYREVQANRAALDACPRHLFPNTLTPAEIKVAFGGKVTCEHCNVKMGLIEIAQYVRGFIAAGGDPNVVWPGYTCPNS